MHYHLQDSCSCYPRDNTATDQQLWEPLLIAPIIGAPELVIPGTWQHISSLDMWLIRAAGRVYYESRISGRREPLPVCVSLMGLPGRPLSLL